MSDIAIRVENLSKQYKIGVKRHDRLKDLLSSSLNGLFRRSRSPVLTLKSPPSTLDSRQSEYIWALKDVSFEVKQGETLGIIGTNGAGKSTLLKILSRITEPTSGRAEISGRVGSLLEVGTGFDRELTGRENIYLNGAILGMTKREIDGKFHEIVDFSGVEQFIDTPVKRYSNGMYVRLAFAVAAHLETEILIVDEVLAVGDAAFQRKCLGKMEYVARGGRTVLFVSHNMAAVQALCSRAILIQVGNLVNDAPTDETVREYLARLNSHAGEAFADTADRSGSGGVRFTRARVFDESKRPTRHLVAGRPASFEFRYQNSICAKRADVFLTIYNHLGIPTTNLNTSLTDYVIDNLGIEGNFVCSIPHLPLPVGQYRIAVAIDVNGETVDYIQNALTFEVESSQFYNTSRTPDVKYCACMVLHEWRHECT